MTTQVDVIIIGGGMVGCTLAVALSQEPSLNILVIEAVKPTPISETERFDLRICALNQASESLLTQLAIWQHIPSQRQGAFHKMIIWEDQHNSLEFNSTETDFPTLGTLVENRQLQQAALHVCHQKPNITLTYDAPIKQQGQIITLANGTTYQAPLIVGADGAQSQIRQWAEIPFTGDTYDQSAIVCTVTTEKSHQQTARQRFLNSGPLAFLPLADPHQCNIVWSQTHHEAQQHMQSSNDDFIKQLNQAFDYQLGDILSISQRASFPLQRRHAKHYVLDGLALVGDAAHIVHPLAGQGVNLGLLDAVTLADVVLDAHRQGQAIGQHSVLMRYQRRRKADNILMQ
ncbi:MAG TPA: FAD-binding protein, partial [Gammaproteobacteria bacterium]|nr:FAD-binding protein [Gammaproteobacteria bacterium]